MAKVKTKKQELQATIEYIAFLEKRLASESYKAHVAMDEISETQEKLKKARFRLKVLSHDCTQ